ncbi:sulfurtransferase complex subunit TusD [Halomonas sp. LS-001]
MQYALLVLGAPFNSQAPSSALRFAHALIAQGHQLEAVFFHHDGVFNASTQLLASSEHAGIYQQWLTLHEQHDVKFDVCVTAAKRRGLIDINAAAQEGRQGYSVTPPFELTGIGQLIDLQRRCDRFISFAP